jgi:hypothetical protein
MPEGAIRPNPACNEGGCKCDCGQLHLRRGALVGDECAFGNTCVPYYGPGEAPEPTLENLGVCLDADNGPCVGKSALECLGG